MIGNKRRTRLVLLGTLMLALWAQAQTQRQGETLSIKGYAGEAPVVQLRGRAFVDVQEMARITNGSLSFERGRIILTLPVGNNSERTGDAGANSGFSRPFMRAAIEAMASMREWGGMLMMVVQNGYPLGTAMPGSTIMTYQARAAESVALAAAAATTDSDYRGLELLKNELNNAQAWSDSFVKARNSHNAASVMSERALKDNEELQKMVRCGEFLAQMFAGGTFQDDVVCR